MFAKIYYSLSTTLVGAIATSGNAHGVFADVGLISVFVSNHILCVPLSFISFDRPQTQLYLRIMKQTLSLAHTARY